MTAAPVRKPQKFSISTGRKKVGQRVLIYGGGGVGKSTLAGLAPSPVIIDVEGSNNNYNVKRVDGITTYQDALDALREPSLWKDAETVVIDTMTKMQSLMKEHLFATKTGATGQKLTSMEDFEYGKGWSHLYDAGLMLLAEADRHVANGRNVIINAHEIIIEVPNPEGGNYIAYRPDIVSTGKTAMLREYVKGWADHVLFMNYEVLVHKDENKDLKAKGRGTRCIYTQERPAYWAKVRDPNGSVPAAIPFTDRNTTDIWNLLLTGKESQ